VRLGRNKKGMGKGFLTTRGSLGGRESGGERGDGEDRRRRLEFEDGGGGSVGGVRDPADLNGSMGKPPMRRGREEGRLESFTGSEGVRAAAMALRPALQSVTRRARAREAWKLGGVRRGCGSALGVFI
jgi:hypothetical protein